MYTNKASILPPAPLPSPILPSASQDDVWRQGPPHGVLGANSLRACARRGQGGWVSEQRCVGAVSLPQLEVQKICTCVVVFCSLPILVFSLTLAYAARAPRSRTRCMLYPLLASRFVRAALPPSPLSLSPTLCASLGVLAPCASHATTVTKWSNCY